MKKLIEITSTVTVRAVADISADDTEESVTERVAEYCRLNGGVESLTGAKKELDVTVWSSAPADTANYSYIPNDRLAYLIQKNTTQFLADTDGAAFAYEFASDGHPRYYEDADELIDFINEDEELEDDDKLQYVPYGDKYPNEVEAYLFSRGYSVTIGRLVVASSPVYVENDEDKAKTYCAAHPDTSYRIIKFHS